MAKIYVVTGGGSGIGKTVAHMLPKEDTIVITGRNLSKLETVANEMNDNGYHVTPLTCDVSKKEDVEGLATKVSAMGEIAKVFHCAGISGTMGSPEDVMRTNALGTVYVNRAFYKVMNGGVICDISSDSGYMLPKLLLPSKKVYNLILTDEEAFLKKMVKKTHLGKDTATHSSMAYLISKNFVRWYSQNCAYKYMANKGIRVFSVSPGFVKTPMTDAEKGQATDCMLSYSALNRGAEPEELAYLITTLADDRCSYLLGSDILCDAGCVNNGYGMFTATKKYDGHAKNENW